MSIAVGESRAVKKVADTLVHRSLERQRDRGSHACWRVVAMKTLMTRLTGLVFCVWSVAVVHGGTIYVDTDATGTGDGSSWANAKTDLATAVAGAQSGDDVWVAEGHYPGTVELKDGVAIYGGFRGNETVVTQADRLANKTFIDGGGRPVRSVGNDATAILNGFYIIRGFVACPEYGAAIELSNSNAKITDCVFTQNRAEALGGVACVWGGSPTFDNCIFHRNDGGWGAGAVFNRGNATPTFTNCLFYGNTSWEGGAIVSTSGAPTLVNCTLANNTATKGQGGAIFDSAGQVVLRNCILWNNSSAKPGSDELYNNPALGGTTTVTYSNIKGGWTGTGNIDVDPKFAYAAGGNYQLLSGSPCIDAADNAAATASTDLKGVTRKLDDTTTTDTGSGTAPIVDMGANEFDGRSFYADRVPKNRYISIIPDSPGTTTAIRVTLERSELFPAAEGRSWWVQTPFAKVDGTETLSISRLDCFPVFLDLTGVDVLHIGDSEIVPSATYVVESVTLGSSLCTSGGDFSPPSRVRTTDVWGDVAQVRIDPNDPWTLPDGMATTYDADAVSDKISSTPGAPPLVRCDVHPEIPNCVVNSADETKVADAGASPPATYPYSEPAACTAGCAYGKCCNSITSTCSNTLQADCTGFGKTWTSGVFCEQQSPSCSGGGGGPPE